MPLSQSLPPKLLLQLEAEFPGEGPLFAMAADLDPQRHGGQTWVALCPHFVFSFPPKGPLLSIPLTELKEARIDEGFGTCRLVADLKNESRVEIACYTATLVPEFAALTRLINDRASGRATQAPDAIEPAFCPTCGQGLTERGATCSRCVPRWRVVTRLTALLKPYRFKVTVLMTLTFFMIAVQLLPPFITKQIVDRVITPKQTGGELILWVAALIGCALFFLLARLAHGRLTGWLSARLVTDLRQRLHGQLQRLHLIYHQRRESGELVGRVMNDTGELQQFLIEGLPFLISNSISFVAIAGILLSINAPLALLVFLPVPFLIFGGGFFWRKLEPLFHRRGSRISQMHTAINETMVGIKAVKAFGQESRRDGAFGKAAEGWFQVNTHLHNTWVGFSENMMFIMSTGVALVWYFAARNIASGGNFSLGDLLAFVGYIWMFYGPLQWFTAIFNWTTHATTAAVRIFAVLDEKTETENNPPSFPQAPCRGEIVFEDVRFSYERGKEVLKGVSFRVEAGTMVGLVGKSGSGKSTLISLICRFYHPDSGRLILDGVPLDQVSLGQLRKNIGVVMQDPWLFNGSLLENIRFGRPEASFEEVVRAARAARAHEFILDKEEGYDTLVGEGGAKLSGGERQRLSIARAILHDPPLLILDEATSAVDSETEKAIQEAIANLIQGRTTVAIAHRLATLRHAHRLVVVEDGRVAEEGTHEELLAKGDGHFTRLVKLQTENNRMREAFVSV